MRCAFFTTSHACAHQSTREYMFVQAKDDYSGRSKQYFVRVNDGSLRACQQFSRMLEKQDCQNVAQINVEIENKIPRKNRLAVFLHETIQLRRDGSCTSVLTLVASTETASIALVLSVQKK
jgi:hypothetical protein